MLGWIDAQLVTEGVHLSIIRFIRAAGASSYIASDNNDNDVGLDKQTRASGSGDIDSPDQGSERNSHKAGLGPSIGNENAPKIPKPGVYSSQMPKHAGCCLAYALHQLCARHAPQRRQLLASGT